MSWFDQEVYDVLQRWDLCLCAIDVNVPTYASSWGDLPSGTYPLLKHYPYHTCTWGAYVRFHGASQPPSTG